MSFWDFKLDGKVQILLWVFILLSVLIYFLGKQIPQEQINNFIGQFGPLGPIIFIILGVLPYVVAPINGLPFLIAGFYLFGPVTILYLYPTALLGFAINFYLSRRFGRPLLSKFIDKKSIGKIDEIANNHGALTLALLRVFQGGLGDYVSYAYGLTKIKFKTYFAISAIAIIPGQAVWYYFARKTNSIEQFLVVNWILAAVFICTLVVGKIIFEKLKKRA